MQNVFTPSVHSEFSVKRNPNLISGHYYRDDVGGVYQYKDDVINIGYYPPDTRLNNTYVASASDPLKFATMKRNLQLKGTDLGDSTDSPNFQAAKQQAKDISYTQIAPASSPSAYQPQSPAIDIAPPSKPQKQAETEVNYLPWVIGGGVLTLGLGLAIVFLPIRKKPVS